MTKYINRKHSKRISGLTRRVAAIAAAAIAVSSVAASAVELGEVQAVQPGDSVNATVDQPVFPLEKYDNGSYYTKNESPCPTHEVNTIGSNCKDYGGAWQCMAFAKYIYDVYSHRSSWKEIANDTNNSTRTFGSDPDLLKQYIQALGAGAYVRVNDVHSFVITAITSDGFYMYEANYDKQCGVRYQYVTYKDYAATTRTSITKSYAHRFSRSYYNETYHKATCLSYGCDGYAWEKHTFSVNKTGKYACSGCGYTLSTAPGVMSTEDDNL